MTIINVRSPFLFTIGDYGSTQTGSKVELSIYKKGDIPPTSGVGYYSLSKNIVSASQRATRYNISNFVKEFFSHSSMTTTSTSAVDASVNDWVFVDVKLSWYNGTVYTTISNATYVALDGFTEYTDGANSASYLPMKVLLNNNITKQVIQTSSYAGFSFNVIGDVPNYGNRIDAVYTTTYNGSPYTVTVSVINGGEARGVINRVVPLSLYPSLIQFGSDTTISLQYILTSTPTQVVNIKTTIIEECKYTPVNCTYINRFGGWEVLTFFKAQTNSISVKGTDYKLTQEGLYYNTTIGQFKKMNINGKQTVKLNTGWVDENYSELITDLLLSETVLLDNAPVTVKTQSSDLKTTLKDKNINYEIEFEYAFNLINDAI